jgi:hypothetical protein
MKLGTILLATALAVSSECALAQTGTSLPGTNSAAGLAGTNAGAPASGSANAGAMSGITTGVGGVSTLAGSAAAGANSTFNPSGNSFINTSPSGSTIQAVGGQLR